MTVIGRWLTAIAGLVATAVLVFFGFGLTPVGAVAWLIPLPALLMAPRLPTWAVLTSAFVGFVLGTTRNWGFYAHSHDEPLVMGLGISAGFAVVLVLAVWLFRTLLRRGRPMAATVAAPAVWTGLLFLVSLVSPAGLIGTFATTQGDVPVVLQLASVTGLWGVDYVVVFAACAVAALAAPGIPKATRLRTAALGVAVVAVVLGFGIVRLTADDLPSQRVAMIADDPAGWAPRDPAIVASYVDRIEALPPEVRTVVLPEGAFGVDTAQLSTIVTPMRAVARERGIDIVVGVARADGTRRYGEAYTFPAGGGAPVVYTKWHDMVTVHGHDLTFPPVRGARSGVEICGDVAFPDPANGYARGGARILYLPASTEGDNGRQMSRSAVLRGVENGEAVVWAGRTGELLAADGHGRVRGVVHTGQSGPFTTLVADVAPGPGETLYSRFGDWFAWLCVAGALGSLWLRYSRR